MRLRLNLRGGGLVLRGHGAGGQQQRQRGQKAKALRVGMGPFPLAHQDFGAADDGRIGQADLFGVAAFVSDGHQDRLDRRDPRAALVVRADDGSLLLDSAADG